MKIGVYNPLRDMWDPMPLLERKIVDPYMPLRVRFFRKLPRSLMYILLSLASQCLQKL